MKYFIAFAAVTSVLAFARAESVAVRFGPGHRSWKNRTKVTVEKDGTGFTVGRVDVTNTQGTAWQTDSAAVAVPKGSRAWSLSFEMRDTGSDWIEINGVNGWQSYNDGWASEIRWIGSDGRRVSATPITPEFRKGERFGYFRFNGVVPTAAASLTVHFGVDEPRIKGASTVSVRGSRIEFFECPEDVPKPILPDTAVPEVFLVSESPTLDAAAPVRFRILDDHGVDWPSLRVFGCDGETPLALVRDGDEVSVVSDTPLAPGIHRYRISVSDVNGNTVDTKRLVCIGAPPSGQKISLRDDGMALVDGRPFFPIGVYGVAPRDFNAFDIDRAFADLANVGFNFAQSYTHFREPAFLAAAKKHGFRLWTPVPGVEDGGICAKWIRSEVEGSPIHLAWYLADDTSHNILPETLLERHECVRAIDGGRLTCQADPIDGWRVNSNLKRYVRYADVFMPEIYPVGHPHERPADFATVAVTIRDMERARADIRNFGDGRPRAIWPILPVFKGWGWSRFPSAEEFDAIVFAAIVHGANGITYYTYGGYQNPAKGAFNYGCTSSADVWAMTSNTTRRVAALAPVLAGRTPQQPPPPVVVEGPAADPLGQPSISLLLKHHDGNVYAIAVNSARGSVTARMQIPGAMETGIAIGENRTVSLEQGVLVDEFHDFGVHIYRFPERGWKSRHRDGLPDYDGACPGRVRMCRAGVRSSDVDTR